MMVTARPTSQCTETGFGGSSGLPMEVGFQRNGAERPKISRCRQTMMGMARLTLRCTETGFGGSSGLPMAVGFHNNGADSQRIFRSTDYRGGGVLKCLQDGSIRMPRSKDELLQKIAKGELALVTVT